MFNNVFNSVFVYTVFLSVALVVLDDMRTRQNLRDASLESSIIDISSSEEEVDMTNDLDSSEIARHYITDVNSSNFAQE